MHRTRKTLSNIGTVIVCLEHAKWAVVQLCTCCINTYVASVLWYIGDERHLHLVLQSQIMPVGFLDIAKYTETDASISDDTNI